MSKRIRKCPVCHDFHEVDNTGWVQACFGYFPEYFLDLDPYAIEMMKRAWSLKR